MGKLRKATASTMALDLSKQDRNCILPGSLPSFLNSLTADRVKNRDHWIAPIGSAGQVPERKRQSLLTRKNNWLGTGIGHDHHFQPVFWGR